MQNTSVHTELNNAKCRILDKDAPINVLSQGSVHCKSGKWFIPADKYESIFLKNINEELVKNPLKQMHFLELPDPKHNMLKVDLDFRFRPTDEELKNRKNFTRRYNDEYIELFAHCLAEALNEIIDIKENYNIYIQEKKEPRLTNDNTNTLKDGIINKFIKLDDLVKDNIIKETIGIIHLDVEGMEKNAIIGGFTTIEKYKPYFI